MTLPLPTALTPDGIVASELGQNPPAYRAAPYPHNRLLFVLPILLDWWLGAFGVAAVSNHCQKMRLTGGEGSTPRILPHFLSESTHSQIKFLSTQQIA